MICIISGNYHEARTWASGQGLEDHEWFYPKDETDLLSRKDFHVIVIGTAGQNVPANYFERIWSLARMRGKIK